MSVFTGTLILAEREPGRRWQLWDELVWEVGAEGSGQRITVPAGFATDGATMPPALRLFLAVWGTYGRAAALHDYLYSILRDRQLVQYEPLQVHPAYASADLNPARWFLDEIECKARRWADEQFYDAMIACGTKRWLARLMWAAVRLWGGRALAADRARG